MQSQNAVQNQVVLQNEPVVQSQPEAEGQPATRPADDYPLDTCPVGGKLGSMGDAVVETIDGRTVKFCCKGCVGTFKNDAEKYHAKMDQMIIEAKADDYPMDECLVSAEPLDIMGDPLVGVHRESNRVVKFCCGSCELSFLKNPDRFLKRLDAAQAKTE
jgi:YHS domain-containing protein